MRKTLMVNGGIYHIYNRGVDKRDIFIDNKDRQRFTDSLIVFNNIENLNGRRFKELINCQNKKPLVNIIAYCLMPNHFHLLLEQCADNGIERFIHKTATSYTMFFNKRHSRSGILLQGVFKRSHIKNNSRLLDMSRYIHANPIKILSRENPEISIKVKLLSFPWSSYPDYTGIRTSLSIIKNSEIITDQFKNPQQYEKYVLGEA